MDTMSDTALREDIVAAVTRCIADSLAVEPEEVTLKARLIDDLGADSLDFVDIIFMLDSELDIGVRDSEFNFITRLDFSSPEVMQQGFITEDVLSRLDSWLPALSQVDDRAQVSPQQLFSLITVEAMCIVASRRAGAGKTSADNAGADTTAAG